MATYKRTTIRVPTATKHGRYSCTFYDETEEVAFVVYGNSHVECEDRVNVIVAQLRTVSGEGVRII